MEGGVVARFLGSLIDPGRQQRAARDDRLLMRAIAMTTRGEGRARRSPRPNQSYAAAASMALISRAFVVP